MFPSVFAMDRPLATAWVGSCPAKINLRLAVTGRRPDNYHHLISLVAAISLLDELELDWQEGGGEDRLLLEGITLEGESSDNLVLRAITAFRRAFPFPGSITARLHKGIPPGSGLGGGSSDAAATLRGLQSIWGDPLDAGTLHQLARSLGADVPFFLEQSPAIMRGTGDELTPMPIWKDALRDWQVAVFRPFFGISTPWAYRILAERGGYTDIDAEEARYTHWLQQGLALTTVPANDFRTVVDQRYPTIPVLLARINQVNGVVAEMTGSGSACFALCQDSACLDEVNRLVHAAWGTEAFSASVRFW